MSSDNTQSHPSQSTAKPKLLDWKLPPPPPSPQDAEFRLVSPAIPPNQWGIAAEPSSSVSRRTSSQVSPHGFTSESPATTLTLTSTTGSLDPLSLPPSSYSSLPGNPDSTATSPFLGGEANWTSTSLLPPDVVSFNKGNQAFKLAYERLNVCQSAVGELKHIELASSDPDGFVNSSFIHTFPTTSFPIPHLEKPLTAQSEPPYVISFLDSQAVQVSGVTFSSQPHYVFSNWNDCVQFQETLLGKRLLFVAGMARARSKGRGEESISQNLRVLQSPNGGITLLFFPNSHRKGQKRYLWLSGAGIDSVEVKKESVTLKLNPDSLEIVSALRTLYIEFFSPVDAENFCNALDPERKDKAKTKGKGKA